MLKKTGKQVLFTITLLCGLLFNYTKKNIKVSYFCNMASEAKRFLLGSLPMFLTCIMV